MEKAFFNWLCRKMWPFFSYNVNMQLQSTIKSNSDAAQTSQVYMDESRAYMREHHRQLKESSAQHKELIETLNGIAKAIGYGK